MTEKAKISVLFVCDTNRTISPATAAMFRKAVDDLKADSVSVTSCGLICDEGMETNQCMRDALYFVGSCSVDGHRTRRLEDKDFTAFSHIVCLNTLESVRKRAPKDATAQLSFYASYAPKMASSDSGLISDPSDSMEFMDEWEYVVGNLQQGIQPLLEHLGLAKKAVESKSS